MIDFEKELEKYTPALQIDAIADYLEQDDLSDVTDILKDIYSLKQ